MPTEGSPLPSASLRTIVATIDPPEKGEHDASEDTVNTLKEEVYDAPGEQTDTLTGEVRDASEEPADILTEVEHDAAGELADTLAEEVRDTAEQPAFDPWSLLQRRCVVTCRSGIFGIVCGDIGATCPRPGWAAPCSSGLRCRLNFDKVGSNGLGAFGSCPIPDVNFLFIFIFFNRPKGRQ